MTLGDLIKKYREENKLSMAEFASKSGLSKAYISLLEKNKNPKTGKEITPSIDVIKKVSDAIGLDFDEVFSSIDSTTKIVIPRNIIAAFADDKAEKTFINNAAEILKNTTIPTEAIPYVPEPMLNIPLVGSVSCGRSLFAEDNIEGYIPTPKSRLNSGETYFWLHAKGDSMINAGIYEGDLLLIRSQDDVDSGDIAVVSINGDEATLKRVFKKENAIVLQPENPIYEMKIFVGKEMENIHIRGRLMELRKSF